MTSRIQPLPDEVVHRIAAGEVIDSLAAAVRELVENALDAGATRITVSVWVDQWKVRVADNGAGMSLDDLTQAASAHSTSKIRDSADLWQIRSLGFRGEALHSLAQLADLEICSRWQDSPDGWWVRYDAHGVPLEREVVAIAPGTVVTVNNLFGQWLPRRQSLPSAAQQLRAIQLTLHHIALCHPQVTWQVDQGDRPWFALWGGRSAQQILPQILREVQPSDLHEWITAVDMPAQSVIPADSAHPANLTNSVALADSVSLGDPANSVNPENLANPLLPEAAPISPADTASDFSFSTDAPSLALLLGLPDRCHRYRPDWVKVAVNGRMVRLPELEQTIIGALRRTLPRDRYPVCFLHLHLSPDHIDWNRHPAKAELYIRTLDQWQTWVSQAIDQALQFAPGDLADAVQGERLRRVVKTAEQPGQYPRYGAFSDPDGAELLGVDSAAGGDRSRLHPNLLEQSGAINPGADPARSPQPSSLRAVAQVHQMYILAEHPAGVWLIEQHIAHERVLYEQLRDRWQLVPLDPPLLLGPLSPRQIEHLQRLGLQVDLFGDALWAIRTVPEPLSQRDDCADAILEISRGGDLDAALVAIACRTAIRNGTPLTLAAMQTLLDQWQQTRNPRTCPHGRPICMTLNESSLSRFFRRHWVIGKSHGI